MTVPLPGNQVSARVVDNTNTELFTTGNPAKVTDSTSQAAIGAVGDVESASGNGTVIAILKRLRTLLAGGLPAALSAGGGLKVGIVDALVAGAALIGKVGIDQTTPGVTDGVSVNKIAGQTPTLDSTAVLAVSNRGKVTVAGDTAFDMLGSPLADARSNSVNALIAALFGFVWNGTTWDRQAGGTTSSDSSAKTQTGMIRVIPHWYNGSTGQAAPGIVQTSADAATLANALSVLANASGFNGATWDRIRAANIFKPQSAVSINAEATIWTPAGGKKFRVMGYHLVSSVAGTITLRDNTAGTIILEISSGAGGSGVFVGLGNGKLSAAANNVLTAQGPLTATLTGVIFGTEE